MSTVTTTYGVTGMTCGHCEAAVTAEVTGVPGVTAASADAKTGTLSVTSDGPPDQKAVGAAVDEAGYTLVDPA
jgi:copper chaperone CopZ